MAETVEFAAATGEIPAQKSVPWKVVFSVAISNLKRRIFRSFIAMIGVILAIAFLTYMLVCNSVIQSLIGANLDPINVLLQQQGVDILARQGTETRMYILMGLSLLTCLVGIMNAMLMSVAERVKEIGTLKCLGALDSFIVKTFFVESLLQGVMGTLTGIVIGGIVGLVVSLSSYGSYVLQYLPILEIITSVVLAFVIGTSISMLASIAPAYWAARKQPVDALRVEE
ncbi:MAG TPA: FtsX-like permease family protein [Planctomycetota bacterium]|nr:FtsX-like permease family protein [Planctomycetota bacterium]